MLLAQQTALSGGEQRPAGTSPAVAGICRLVAIRFMLVLKGLAVHCSKTPRRASRAYVRRLRLMWRTMAGAILPKGRIRSARFASITAFGMPYTVQSSWLCAKT